MPNTWSNHPCVFTTRNTTNDKGDSVYTVTSNQMKRYAPVNAERAPEQVHTGNPSICYLEPGSKLLKAVMQQSDDAKVTVIAVQDDDIRIKVQLPAGKHGAGTDFEISNYVGRCSRRPKVGWSTFDFHNNNGVLKGIHVGHGVFTIREGG